MDCQGFGISVINVMKSSMSYLTEILVRENILKTVIIFTSLPSIST
jgi:hypothetical protein